MSCGWNASSAGATTRSNTARYAPPPEPGGRGMLSVVPVPLPPPTSARAPTQICRHALSCVSDFSVLCSNGKDMQHAAGELATCSSLSSLTISGLVPVSVHSYNSRHQAAVVNLIPAWLLVATKVALLVGGTITGRTWPDHQKQHKCIPQVFAATMPYVNTCPLMLLVVRPSSPTRANGVVAVLVYADEQHAVILPEGLLCTIAMVHVIVHNGHPAEAPNLQGMGCCYGDVVEHTETHACTAQQPNTPLALTF